MAWPALPETKVLPRIAVLKLVGFTVLGIRSVFVRVSKEKWAIGTSVPPVASGVPPVLVVPRARRPGDRRDACPTMLVLSQPWKAGSASLIAWRNPRALAARASSLAAMAFSWS